MELNTDSLADEQEETTSEDVDGDCLVNTEPSEGTAKNSVADPDPHLALLYPDPNPRSKEIDQN